MENQSERGSSRGSRRYLANKFGRAVDTILEDYNPDKYIDDENLYVPRIHRDKVDAYNAYAVNEAHFEYEKSLKIRPISHSDSIVIPSYREKLLFYLLSMHWDRIYLVLFTVWCIIYGVTIDEYFIRLSHYSSNANFTQFQILTVISILPILMLISALIPCLTVCCSMGLCHNMLKKTSIRTMRSWSIVAIFISQFLEFNYHEIQALLKYSKSNRIQPLPVVRDPMAPQLNDEDLNHHSNGPGTRDPARSPDGDVHSIDIENPGVSNEGGQQRIAASVIFETDKAKAEDFEMKTEQLGHGDDSREVPDMDSSDFDVEVNKVYPRSMFIETGEFVAGLRQVIEEQENHNERNRKLKMKMKREQAILKDPRMKEWTCVTCNRFNFEPALGYHDEDLFVVEGDEICPRVFMKQMEHSIPKPICSHCMTPFDYIPPDCSRHLFPQKGNKITAFANYPIPHHLRANVNLGIPWHQRMKRFIRPDTFRKINFRLPMDWRLPLYLSSQLPEPLRYEIQGPSFLLGEAIECRVQKLEWTKATIVNDRRDGYYDICYESGEEVGRHIEIFVNPKIISFLIG